MLFTLFIHIVDELTKDPSHPGKGDEGRDERENLLHAGIVSESLVTVNTFARYFVNKVQGMQRRSAVHGCGGSLFCLHFLKRLVYGFLNDVLHSNEEGTPIYLVQELFYIVGIPEML